VGMRPVKSRGLDRSSTTARLYALTSNPPLREKLDQTRSGQPRALKPPVGEHIRYGTPRRPLLMRSLPFALRFDELELALNMRALNSRTQSEALTLAKIKPPCLSREFPDRIRFATIATIPDRAKPLQEARYVFVTSSHGMDLYQSVTPRARQAPIDAAS